jgi:flagellar hook-associated protein 3 FlgL
MRISTAFAFESSLANLQRRQSALTDTQEQLTSGKRVQRASDDPAASALAERALAASSRAVAQQRALDASKNDMQLSESALGDGANLLNQARDLVVTAGNGSYTDSDRATLVQQLQGLRTDLLAVANRKDANGRYLFGGQGSDTQPLVDAPGGVTFSGAAGQQRAATSEAMPMSIDGRSAWLQAPDPARPGNTISLFDSLDQTISALSTTGQSSAQIAQIVSTGLGGIDAAAANLSSWRSHAGAQLTRADGIEARLSQAKLDAQTQRSAAEDLDMVQAVSEFQSRQSGYDAALKTYSMVQQMSLFQYIK